MFCVYFGIGNVDGFLMHVQNTVHDLQDTGQDNALGAGLFEFVDLLEEARAHAPVVDACESVFVREPFQDFSTLHTHVV